MGLILIIEERLMRGYNDLGGWVIESQSLRCWEFTLDDLRPGQHQTRPPSEYTVISVNMVPAEVKSFERLQTPFI